MAATGWGYEDAKQHFFIYMERIGTADLLHELRGTPVARNVDVNNLAKTLFENLKANAFATSAPFYTAMLGAHSGRASAVEQLMKHAASTGDRDVLRSAVTILQDSGAFIQQSLETMQLVQQRSLMPDAFQALLRQGTAMAWGAFETFCFDLFRLLFTTKLSLLRTVVAAQANGTPWSGTPKKLLEWIEAETRANPSLTNNDAFESLRNNLPSMNLRATRHFSSVLFAGDATLAGVLGTRDLSMLSARRHLLLHNAGIVNQRYVTDTGESLSIGTSLIVAPRDLALGFRAASSAAAALAQAASSAL